LHDLLRVGLSACEKGPAEKAGESIDDAASDIADKSEDAADTMKEKLDNQQSLGYLFVTNPV